MSTDLETYSKNAHTVAGESGSTAAIILEQDSDEWSLNAYNTDGTLSAYLVATDFIERARILALGRAIVEALDPVPDPPQEEPVDESVRQRLEAWDSIADHPFFEKAFAGTGPLIVDMLRQLDGLIDQPSAESPDDECRTAGDAFELVSDPTLPLDVEIRTIALDAAVRVLEHTGGSLVEGAAKVERFLLGQQDEPAEPAPRWTVGQELTIEDLNELPVGTVVVDEDGDHGTRLADNGLYAGTGLTKRWSRGETATEAGLPSERIAAYGTVTLVSLP